MNLPFSSGHSLSYKETFGLSISALCSPYVSPLSSKALTLLIALVSAISRMCFASVTLLLRRVMNKPHKKTMNTAAIIKSSFIPKITRNPTGSSDSVCCTDVGRIVGDGLGSRVGIVVDVGEMDGEEVGTIVGLLVGLGVGNVDGMVVGVNVVGDIVGAVA